MNKKKFEFSGVSFILGCFYFFLAFVLLHGYWIGEPFESFLSLLATIYLGACTWAFPYIIAELEQLDSVVERLGYTIFEALSIVLYFFAPFVYIWLKFFNEKDEKVIFSMSKKKFEFSGLSFIAGCFYFFFSFVVIHTAWLGNPFESLLSILVIIYLGLCTWALSYTLKEFDQLINFVVEKPLGRVLLMGLNAVLYFVSPVVYIWLKFLTKNK